MRKLNVAAVDHMIGLIFSEIDSYEQLKDKGITVTKPEYPKVYFDDALTHYEFRADGIETVKVHLSAKNDNKEADVDIKFWDKPEGKDTFINLICTENTSETYLILKEQIVQRLLFYKELAGGGGGEEGGESGGGAEAEKPTEGGGEATTTTANSQWLALHKLATLIERYAGQHQ